MKLHPIVHLVVVDLDQLPFLIKLVAYFEQCSIFVLVTNYYALFLLCYIIQGNIVAQYIIDIAIQFSLNCAQTLHINFLLLK